MTDKMPDDLHFDQSVSWFIGQFDGDEDEMWERVDVINNYAKDYKKLYWELLSSWAELKTKHGALLERLDEQFDKEAIKRMFRSILSEEDTSENMAIQDRFINKTVDAMFERFKIVRRDINGEDFNGL